MLLKSFSNKSAEKKQKKTSPSCNQSVKKR